MLTDKTTGTRTGEVRYMPWGEDRYSYGTSPTTYRYTGQRQEASIGLYFYGARWYDPALGRFVSPDSIVPNPGDPVSWDRYAYVTNNSLGHVDPTGHRYEEAGEGDESNNDSPSDGKNPLDDIVGDQSDPDEQPLCGPNTPGCDPYSDKVWSYDDIQGLINTLEQYRDSATAAAILAGIAAAAGGTTPLGVVLGLVAAELTWESYTADTLIEYLNSASDIASTNDGVRISFYHHKDAYAGIPVVIYYEGADAEFVVTSVALFNDAFGQ